MRYTQSCLAVGAIVVSMALPGYCWAKSPLEARLERLENIVNNQVNVDLLQQIEDLQQEVRELRGKLEEQQHETTLLSQKQEKLFLNLDSRMSSLMKNSAAVAKSILPPESVADPLPTSVNVTTLNPDASAEELQDAANTVHANDSMWHATEQSEKETYENSYKLVTAKQYPEALTAFKEYLLQYPQGTYAANAYYWIGEVYAAQWQNKRSDQALIENSISAFQSVVNKFPKHHKAEDALLKLGIVEADLQHWDLAKQYLDKVIQQYPNTSGSRIAENKLQQIQQNLGNTD